MIGLSVHNVAQLFCYVTKLKHSSQQDLNEQLGKRLPNEAAKIVLRGVDEVRRKEIELKRGECSYFFNPDVKS